ETIGAAEHVPRGMVRAVLVSATFGWLLLAAALVGMADVDVAAHAGDNAFATAMKATLPPMVGLGLFAGVAATQYVCALACVTSASRMAYAFARDGGIPGAALWRRVHVGHATPVPAIWLVAAAALGLNALAPYPAVAAACAVLLYVSYVLPTALGLAAHGRRWTRFGPWTLGRWYRP